MHHTYIYRISYFYLIVGSCSVKLTSLFSAFQIISARLTHGKNNFAEVSKNLAIYRSQRTLFGPSKWCKTFLIARMFLQNFRHQVKSVHNYFDGSTKLCLDPYLAKFLKYLSKVHAI